MSKWLIAALFASTLSSMAYAGAYATNLDDIYKRAESHWNEISTTQSGKFHGVETASLKQTHIWDYLIEKPTNTNYLKADNKTYRLRFNATGPETAQIMRSSPDSNMKGYLVGY